MPPLCKIRGGLSPPCPPFVKAPEVVYNQWYNSIPDVPKAKMFWSLHDSLLLYWEELHAHDGGSSCHCACARDLLSATLSSLLSRVSAVTC